MQGVRRWSIATILLALLVGAGSLAAANESPKHVLITVQAGKDLPAGLSGRLLVFLKKGSGDSVVDTSLEDLNGTWIAAKEISNLNPGQSVLLDADDQAFPKGFSALPTGHYELQVVLDVDHDYNYGGRKAADWVSPVVSVDWKPSAHMPVLTLSTHAAVDPKRAAALQANLAKVKPDQIHPVHFTSTLLTQFWGSPRQINAWVVLPPGYDEKSATTYPTAYWTHGFGGNFENSVMSAVRIRERMDKGQAPAMIWVMLDESCPQGTHEFADSVNNGPWGAALTSEFIPWLEQHYRMDATRNGRFLTGHSSGGWATLQLQVNYPKIFGGTWSTSPDPSDFHDFTGINLYAAHANMFVAPDGTPAPLVRKDGKVVVTMAQYVKNEAVLGAYGGQFGSFDWVFSPKSANGAPVPMFNRVTGEVDPQVVAYWHDHYDLANIVQRDWSQRGADLQGTIHLIVGTADTFYLDGAAHKFQAVLDSLKAGAQFTYIPGRSHFDLYAVGDDRGALTNQIAAQMYAIARPAAK